MLSKLNQKALDSVVRNIQEGHSCSGGEWSKQELLADEVKLHQMNAEEIAYCEVQLNRGNSQLEFLDSFLRTPPHVRQAIMDMLKDSDH